MLKKILQNVLFGLNRHLAKFEKKMYSPIPVNIAVFIYFIVIYNVFRFSL